MLALFYSFAAPFFAPVQVAPPQLIFGTPRYPTDVTTGDLDGDGDSDVLITSRDDNTLRWVENLGNRQFAEARIIADGLTGARTVATLDIDGDGDLDVISGGEYSDRVELHLNLGGGTFAPPTLIQAQVDRIWRLSAVDMDGDGDQDLFAVVAGANRIGWLENLGGTFAPLSSLVDGVINVKDASLADLNGDGVADILTASSSTGQFLWAPGLGGMAFAALQTIATETGAHTVTAADVDGNGTIDVLTGSLDARTITVYSNGGGATPTFTPVWSFTSGEVRDIATLDFDEDGTLDLVWTSGATVALARQAGPLAFTTVPFTGIGFEGPVGRVHLADLDGDGLVDLADAALTGTGSANGDVVRITWNEPAQDFGEGQRLFPDHDVTWWLESLDLDQDDDTDLVTIQATYSSQFAPMRITVFRAGPSGEFTREDGPIVERMTYLSVADVDSDGDDDVLYNQRLFGVPPTTHWLEQLADGSLAPASQLFSALSDEAYYGVRWVDVDGDGDVDALSQAYAETETFWRENLGAGQLAARQTLLQATAGDLHAAVDFNGDGQADLVRSESGVLRLYPSNGAGGFGPPTTLLPTGPTIRTLPMDADGDGDLDLAVERRVSIDNYQWTTCYLQGASLQGTLTSPIHFRSASDAESVDWDGDGDIDIVGNDYLSADGGTVRLFENAGDGSFPTTSDLFVSRVRPWFMELRDLDGDADADIAIADRTLLLWLENQRSLGTQLCAGEINSTGAGARLDATGSDVVNSQSVVLTVTDVPASSAALLFNSMQSGFLAHPAGSQGNVCLADPIGRYVGSGEIQVADASGRVRLAIDLDSTPTPFGPTSVISGQTWHFQAWYRDANPQSTTNFSSAISILFR